MFVNSTNLVQISSLDKSLMVVGRVGTGKTRELKKMALSLSKVLVLDPLREYEDEAFGKQTEGNVTLQHLDCESNEGYGNFKITEDVINIAKQYEYVIVDETNYLCQGRFYILSPTNEGFRYKSSSKFSTNAIRCPNY